MFLIHTGISHVIPKYIAVLLEAHLLYHNAALIFDMCNSFAYSN